MNKQTVQLPGNQGVWDSYISKYQPDSQKVLDNMFTANSKNFVTDQTGMIDKRQGGVIWNRTTFSGPAADSYDAIFESGAQHYIRVGQGVLSASTGNGIFNVIQPGFSTFGNFEFVTYQDRVYGDNGVDAPIVYDTATSYGGVSYSFTTAMTKIMGAQPPLTAPVSHTPTSGGAVPVGPHRYEITFEYYSEEESNGSIPSNVETTTSGFQTILLTSIPIGGYGVTARNIYRDNDDGVFLLLDTINDNTTTTYTDTLAQGSTPTPIPTDNGVPPTFSKIALWLDSIWIAPTGNTNTLLFSNAGSPDIFGGNNFVVCQQDDTITGLVVYNGTLYVYGLHSFGSIQGTTPDTFYYYNISNTIGCTDNRSIQIRSVVSIPTLWWLSDKGIYYSNGYTVEYGSDLIQDLINLNISQVNYSLGRNTQNSQTQYAGDTYTPGIDITDIPGTITLINSEADYSTTSDWLNGSVSNNIKTSDSNFAEVPTQFTPSALDGTLGGAAVLNGGNVTLPQSSSFSGESVTVSYEVPNGESGTDYPFGWAVSFIPPVSGTFNDFTLTLPGLPFTAGLHYTANMRVWSDSFGVPGAVLYSQAESGTFPGSTEVTITESPNISLSGGTTYWMGMDNITINSVSGLDYYPDPNAGLFSGGSVKVHRQISGWGNAKNPFSTRQFNNDYDYTSVMGPESGTWTSPIYDSGAVNGQAALIHATGIYPAGTYSQVEVYASPNPDMSSSTNQIFPNPTGTNSLAFSTYRYYQIVLTVTTSNSIVVPSMVASPYIHFDPVGTWISQPINTTTDNVGYNNFSYSGNVPANTSIVISIATSLDNITYTSFGPANLANPTAPWVKIQATLSTDTGNTVSPSIAEIILTWNLVSNIVSSPIDTGITPAGFGIAQFVETNPGVGTVTMYVRTATTSGGLSSASYVVVPNGSFPVLTPDEWLQWKLILTSTGNQAPQITSVTLNWFISSGVQGVRCASLFYNKTYYLSVATIGSTSNNTLIQLDQFGKWRIQKDQSVGTLLLYFNTLYFSDGINGNIYNGFIAPTDNGTAITLDARTKAWHDTDDIFLKVPRGLKVTGIHTGTLIHAYYSTDRGNTWNEMFNELGTYGYQTTTTGLEFVVLFVPDADTLIPGRTLMFRLVSEDIFPCSIINFEPTMYSRKGRYLNNG
jgi:hypothetical protein